MSYTRTNDDPKGKALEVIHEFGTKPVPKNTGNTLSIDQESMFKETGEKDIP
jgi:hypothetical protein